MTKLFQSVQLKRTIHASGSNVRGIASEPYTGRHCGVVVEDFEVWPLLAEVDANICSGNCQVGAALVEAEVLDFIALVQLDGLEILQFSQIPKSNAGVVSCCGLKRENKKWRVQWGNRFFWIPVRWVRVPNPEGRKNKWWLLCRKWQFLIVNDYQVA